MKKSSGDENEINKYLTATDDIDASKFLSLMKRYIMHSLFLTDNMRLGRFHIVKMSVTNLKKS
jgi:hypothetical protein